MESSAMPLQKPQLTYVQALFWKPFKGNVLGTDHDIWYQQNTHTTQNFQHHPMIETISC